MTMKFIPILFSSQMVQAIRSGNKTMTRRTKGLDFINESLSEWEYKGTETLIEPDTLYHTMRNKDHGSQNAVKCPYGQMGDVLWVRETFQTVDTYPEPDCFGKYLYKANGDTCPKWKPSLFMPKEACRIFLKITDIKVQRLQDISEDDAVSEGILQVQPGILVGEFKDYSTDRPLYRIGQNDEWGLTPIGSFKTLWQKINGEESWNKNPFVWCISFERVEMPKDFLKVSVKSSTINKETRTASFEVEVK